MANQRYFAVRLPNPLANLIGIRMNGIGYQIAMPKILKKKWQSAIWGTQKQNKTTKQTNIIRFDIWPNLAAISVSFIHSILPARNLTEFLLGSP